MALALGDYVRAVADALGVPPEGTTHEVTDTVTAYVALSCRAPEHPDRDLMLVWTERRGWELSVETGPAERPIVLARRGGDVVPGPEAVARFVAESVAGGRSERAALPSPVDRVDRADLVERLERSARTR
ncbi:hypothetical protein EKG83_20510 [Saccharothrix syringae]|uniref:DUF6292 domain-containing protein n=1 Tax=Saccharothrix syringae TaxID=103733 RepID=A0A5Q0HFL2_SACSY|nr:hypothetical protein EKG83_20510 [Saccharothrix syringae]